MILFLTGCNTTKYLSENQKLLWKNKATITDKYSLDKKINLNQEIATLYKQKPNGSSAFIKKNWIYNFAEKKLKKNSWVYRIFKKYGEPSVVFDTALANKTASNMENYFFNKGYFNCVVTYSTKEPLKKKVEVNYKIKLAEAVKIDSFEIIAADSIIQTLINKNSQDQVLNGGDNIDNLKFQEEKVRIADLLYNNGYADFNPVYFSALTLDTSNSANNVKLYLQNPTNSDKHQRFKIGRVNIYPDYIADVNERLKVTGNRFLLNDTNRVDDISSAIKPNFIRSRIDIKEGSYYNKSNLNSTYQNLTQLGVYRFVSFDTKVDSLHPDLINVDIFLSNNKKWIFDSGLDLNYTSVRAVGANLLGTTGYFNLKNRNLLGKAEAFTTKLQASAEFNFFKNVGVNSFTINYGHELTLPNLYDLTGGIALLRRGLNLFSKNDNSNLFSYTNFKFGLDYVALYKQYSYYSIESKINYNFQANRNTKFSCSTFNFSLYFPNTSVAFDSFLNNNKLLEQSFKGNRLFTSFFLSDLQYLKQRKLSFSSSSIFYSNLDFSGLEISVSNLLYNLIASQNKKFTLLNNEFSRFVKLEIDHRFTTNFKGKDQLVYRYNVGVATPLFGSSNIPYIKQFYVGGPQSLRAWNLREAGPGAARITETNRNSNTYFSTGDIKLESNVEYRFNIVWIFKGALFLDVGNVWLLPKKSETNKLERFSRRFMDQMNVGTGMGLRMDLGYFVFRLDLGVKLRNAYLSEYNRNWIFNNQYKANLNRIYDNSTFHLALNYPF